MNLHLLELVLNFIWCGIAVIGLTAMWRARVSTDIRFRPGIAMLALCCVMALLFPVISASDDLHSSEFTADDANSARKFLNHIESDHHHQIAPVSAGLAIRPATDSNHFVVLMAAVVLQSNSRTGELSLANVISDRAPPAIVL